MNRSILYNLSRYVSQQRGGNGDQSRTLAPNRICKICDRFTRLWFGRKRMLHHIYLSCSRPLSSASLFINTSPP